MVIIFIYIVSTINLVHPDYIAAMVNSSSLTSANVKLAANTLEMDFQNSMDLSLIHLQKHQKT